jgi:ubiquinone/menaquinone biosynthesis C-methylase UbiE
MIDHFNILAPLYDRLISQPDTEYLKTVLDLPVAGRLLDVGGGTGRVTGQLSAFVDDLVLTDASVGMLEQAAKKDKLKLFQAQAERLPFSNDSFERVLVVDALHHFNDQREAIIDLLRVLKPGGRLVIEEPDLNYYSVKLIAVFEKLALMRSHFYTPIEIKAMIDGQGLNARIESGDNFNAWVIVDK